MQKLGDIFIATGLITEADLEKAMKEKHTSLSIAEVLITLGLTTDKSIAEALSTHLNLPLVELGSFVVESEVLERFTSKLANKYMVFPLENTGKTIKLAMANPLDFDAIQAVEFKFACSVSPVVSSYASIRSIIERYYGLEEDIEEIIKDARYDQGPEFLEETPDPSLNILKREGQSSPIVRIVNKVLQKAVKMNASDIHIEPQEKDIQIRYRVDGIMNEVMQLPKQMLNGMVSRIKITASLDIAERRLPQDGSFKMSLEGRAYEIRVSTLPTKFGEKVVMRLLNASNPTVWLDEIGFLPSAMRTVFRFTELKQGIVLATGPTGAGKTTTLYSFIKELLQRKLNIITFEDPIEYQIQGVNQVQINQKKGLTFASGLRSALRQDPDVIMVGEIRDTETLKIALQAAMTGHLVLSTVHTNDATSTIFRLKNIGAENFQISGGLAGVIAQRLIRTICTNCKDIYQPSAQIIDRIAAKVGQDFPYVFYKGKGCEKCSNTGYRGRLGVYEVLNVDSTLQGLIVNDVSEVQLREKAVEAGMVTMARDCIEKLRYGLTTVEELERVFVLEAKTSEKCPNCQRNLNQRFSICPYCSYILLSACFNCNKEMDPEWAICPYCRAEKGAKISIQKTLPYNSGTKYLTGSLPPRRYLVTGEHNQLAFPTVDQEYNPESIEFLPTDYQNNLEQEYLNKPVSLSTEIPWPMSEQKTVQPNNTFSSPWPINPVTPTTLYPLQSNPPSLQSISSQLPASFTQPTKPIKPVEEKPQHSILVVEGDEILLIGLETYLTKEKFNVRVARDGFQALEQMLVFNPELVVVDTMTLRMDGYEFIRSVRQGAAASFLPIIILSTKDSIEDKILGFTLGIDDYLDKPFSSEELTSRIRTVLRRVYG